jgi:hypothetical protein
MILISHRGNINGRIEEAENKPEYIIDTLSMGYDVEVDVWFQEGVWYLGHDKPQYKINLQWLIDRGEKLWIHCKNIEAIEQFNHFNLGCNYFWHESDTVTLTSKNYMWAYLGKQPIKNSIAVLPEIYEEDISKCIGVCSDYIEKYK